jgi:sulfur carrier protein ThiS
MRIRVFAPPFSDWSKLDEDGKLELPEDATLGDALAALRIPLRPAAALLCAVNGEKSGLGRKLAEGDRLSFFSLVSGG